MRPDLGRQLHALDQVGLQRPLLVAVQIAPVPVEHVLVGVTQKAASPRGGITDMVVGCRLHDLAHGLNDGARGEVLAGAARGLLRRAGEKLLVDRALHVHR